MEEMAMLVSRDSASLRKQATDRLRNSILYGQFQPGERLIERELCVSLGVSRSVLREALQHLQAEKLIELVLHKGPVVATLGLEEAQNIYAVRRAVESLMAEEFARHATDDDIVKLSGALSDFNALPGKSDPRELLIAKDRFYSAFVAGCKNPVIGEALALLKNRTTLLRRMTLAVPGRHDQVRKELKSIVRAIQARDPELAAKRCATHVENAAKAMTKCFHPMEMRKESTGS